jgi:LmbE family N-acetylglucosaminyl deacetylase
MERSANGPVAVVSPHLDDAVLGAWTVLARDVDVDVVNVFSGRPEPGFVTRYDRLIRGEESAAMFEERLREDREALSLQGRSPRGLGFLERQYRDGAVDRAALARELARAIHGCSELFLPAGIGGHEDHLAVRDVGLGLANGGLPITLYAEIPYAIHKGWPDWVTGEEPDPHLDPGSDWDHYLDSVPCARDALRVSVRRLSAAEADEKLTALRTYRTQFASLNSGMVNRFGDRAVLRYEVFWRVDVTDA